MQRRSDPLDNRLTQVRLTAEGAALLASTRPLREAFARKALKGLPAGKYLITAVDYVQDGQWHDPEFLADLRPHAQRLSLAEGESKRIDLTVKK